MFTLLRNMRFLLVTSIQMKLEGNLGAFDANNDRDISGEEMTALLENSPEAREAVDLAEVETLEAAAEIADGIDTNNLERSDQRILQYLATKILRLTGQAVSDGSLDGSIGRNSIADINRAAEIALDSKADITRNTISALIQRANGVTEAKRAEFEEARVAREASEVEARAVVANFNVDTDTTDRSRVEALQSALVTLGYTLRGRNNGVDGAWGSSTREAYETERANLQNTAVSEDTNNFRDSKDEVTSAESAVREAEAELARVEEEQVEAVARAEATQEALDQAQLLVEQTDATDKSADDLVLAQQATVNEAAGEVADSRLALVSARARLDALRSSDTTTQTAEEAEATAREAREEVQVAKTALERAERILSARVTIDRQADEAVAQLETELTTLQANFEATGVSEADAANLSLNTASIDELRARQAFVVSVQEQVLSDSNMLGMHFGASGADSKFYIEGGSIFIDRPGVFSNEEVSANINLEVLGLNSLKEVAALLNTEFDRDGNYKTDFESEIEALEDTNSQNIQIIEVYQQLIAKRQELEVARERAIATQTALDSAEGQIDGLESTMTDADQALADATQALSDATGAASSAAEQIQRLEIYIRTLEGDISVESQELADAERVLAAAIEAAEVSEQRLNEANEALRLATEADEAADNELETVTTETESARELVAQYQNTLDRANEDSDEALDALIVGLINSNPELQTLLDSNPEGVRSAIERLACMDENRIASLGNALAYFKVSTDFVGETVVSGDLVVAMIEYSVSEQMEVSQMTPEYLISLNEAYQEKADELGEIIAGLNTRGYLDTGRTAAENFFNVTTGYPDFEYVTNEGGVFSISNGLRGRPRCHTHIRYATTQTYLTQNHHHVIQDGNGETLRSAHASERSQVGSVTVRSSETRRWFEMYAGGVKREQISAMIASGEATLRPSYQMLSRLYEPQINGQEVELVKQPWYAQMSAWSEEISAREGGEESIINREVSIRSKTMGSVLTEVRREAPERYAEIQSEVREEILGSQEFSFLLWEAETGERASALQLVGSQTESGWSLAVFDPTTNTQVGETQTFESGEAMLASDLGQRAMMMSTYRYFGVVTNTTEGGLRYVDDQGLIRCGEHERVVLLDEPVPVLPQGYNFLRNGLPCGVLGAFCTSITTHTTHIRELERDRWTYEEVETSETEAESSQTDDDERESSDTETEPESSDTDTEPESSDTQEDESSDTETEPESSDTDTEGEGSNTETPDSPEDE